MFNSELKRDGYAVSDPRGVGLCVKTIINVFSQHVTERIIDFLVSCKNSVKHKFDSELVLSDFNVIPDSGGNIGYVRIEILSVKPFHPAYLCPCLECEISV